MISYCSLKVSGALSPLEKNCSIAIALSVINDTCNASRPNKYSPEICDSCFIIYFCLYAVWHFMLFIEIFVESDMEKLVNIR